MAFWLESSETIPDGMRRLLLERVEEIIINLTRPEIDLDEGVHEARKNCKRVRAAYRLIRDEIGETLYRRENYRFRDFARLLAGARDSWVMIQTLDQLVLDQPVQISEQVYARLRKILFDQYHALVEQEAKDKMKIPAIVNGLQEACVQIENLPIRHQDFSAFRGGLWRVYFRGRRAFKNAYSQPSPEIFHEWRKRVKYIWHQLEILQPIQPEVLSNLADELHSLSDCLGADHDLFLLRNRILDEQSGLEKNLALVSLIDQGRQNQETLAYPMGGRLFRDPPEIFVQRLETHWDAWQLALCS